MQPESDESQRWLGKAAHVWSVARKIAASDSPETDVAAFHCQQTIEKMLKAFLVFHAQPVEKIHDLGLLMDRCSQIDSRFSPLRDAVAPLTIYAVAFRYPGPADPTIDDVREALRIVDMLWQALTILLPTEDRSTQ